MTQPGNVVELLQHLVRIPSVNPDGDPGTEHTGEQAIAEYVCHFLKDIGAVAAVEPVLPGRPNVTGHFPALAGKPVVLLAPHLDTVSVVGMSIPPFDGGLRDGRVYGRGASDTKGSMAAMLWALREIAANPELCRYDVRFAAVMGEEAGHEGAHLLAKTLKADFAIVGEPTDLRMVHRHKGARWMRLVTGGLAGHGSNPRPHENAILRMATILPEMRAAADAWAADADPVLGATTLNVGVIRGGSKVNIVPDRCEAALDMRIISESPRWMGDLEDIVARHAAYTTLETTGSSPLLDTALDSPLAKALIAHGAAPDVAPWFCDAAIFAKAGVPSVALGPGKIAQAHTADEWIAVDDLLRGAEFFRSFLLDVRAV